SFTSKPYPKSQNSWPTWRAAPTVPLIFGRNSSMRHCYRRGRPATAEPTARRVAAVSTPLAKRAGRRSTVRSLERRLPAQTYTAPELSCSAASALPRSRSRTNDAMDKTERLFAVLDALRRRRSPVTAETLAEEQGVSVRTIYRDVQTLIGLGAPLEG